MFLRIALSNLWRNKRRTLFTEFAIVFGIVVVVFTSAFLNGMFRFWALDQFITATTGAFQIEHRDYREKAMLDPLHVTLTESAALIETIKRVPGVTAAYGELQMTGIVSNGSKSTVFDGRGVDKVGQPQVLTGSNDLIIAGRALGNDPYEVVIGRLLSEKLDVTVGSQIAIVVKTLRGGIELMYATIVGIKDGGHFPSATYLEMNLAQAQRFLRMPDHVSQILVGADNFDAMRATARVAETTVQQAGYPVIVRDYTQLIPMFVTVGSVFKLIGLVISLILFIIVGLGITNALFMAVRERRKEIGTLLAIGMEAVQARWLFLLEGVLLGGLGAGIGVLLTTLLTIGINRHGGIGWYAAMMNAQIVILPRVDWLTVSVALSFALVVSIVAAWFPASASAKLNPVEALMEA